ncbi:sulfatase-like hydrolase/transferase [Agromyces mediolanus]|uniref:sulfatase family protein n=1 Tax=Agromyces mediolanus TaxID=41986 RepID=UPI00203FEAA5|nr:sulfatase-like hydrolase/transferase [Agromyces mediolanus]MCM3658588.1 sulfatase-like hydrolase/transferase [Agromyces mediolanus]
MTRPTAPRTIVLLMVDQLAAKWLELARDGIVELPHFDALQAEGATFRNAFSTNPVCSPSRASIATGLANVSHGVTECGYDLDPEVPTFMRGLQRAGWRTGAFGKLHHVTQLEELAPDYTVYGYDVVANTEDLRAGEWIDWVEREHPEHYEAALSTVWMTMSEDLLDYGPEHVDLRARILAAQERFPESTGEAYELPFPAEVSQTAWITDHACAFIADGGERDLFAHISYVQPHNPFAPPAEFVDRVEVDAIPEPVPAEWAERPIPYFAQERYREPSYAQCDWRRQRQLYFADLAHLDHELGRVRRALAEAGRLEGALFLFTSDHGELLHDQGLVGKWERHYDPCIRVPLVVAAPGAVPGPRAELAEHTDLAATVYDWAGVEPPTLPQHTRAGERRLPMLHGRSLLPSVLGRTGGDSAEASARDAVYIQSNNSHVEARTSSWARTVRTERFRFTYYPDGGGEQLFDLVDDPDEQRNLAADPAWRTTRDELFTRLTELIIAEGFPNSPRELYRIGAW